MTYPRYIYTIEVYRNLRESFILIPPEHCLVLPGGLATGVAAPARAQPHPHGHQAGEHLHREGRHLQGRRLWPHARPISR